MQLLWPQIKHVAKELPRARVMFFTHALSEPCWVRYYGERLWEEVAKLT